MRHVAAWLPHLPEGVRRYAQAEVYRLLQEAGPGPHGRDAAQRAIQAVSTTLPGGAAA
jgi:hypothetical protein